jgi:hypothetical protein
VFSRQADESFTVLDSRFEQNEGYPGGGLWVDSLNSTVSSTDFVANDGGGIYNDDRGNMTVQECTFEKNISIYGGGIFNYGDLYVSGSNFLENIADRGGGIMNKDSAADLYLNTSTFYSNTAAMDASLGSGVGGAIYNRLGAQADITRTTFISNTADEIGGVFFVYASDIHVTNSTLSGNRAGNGGALYVSEGTKSSFTNVTVYGSQVSNSYGGVYLGEFATLTLTHSIIAGSVGGVDCAYDTTPGAGDTTLGYVFDNGYNIIEDGTCLTEDSSLAVDPKLEPLADNGGATQTHALMEDSLAVDMIPANECAVKTDQRGVNRPQGIACDTGAFESSVAWFNLFLPLAIR